MNRKISILCLGCLFFLTGIQAQNNTNQKMKTDPTIIEGLFYLDHQPVAIEIADGKILRFTRKEKLSDPDLADVYVAPGLIDHQVNGYLSHAFVGEDLNLEQVQKITRTFWSKGITTYVPTLTSHRSDLLLKNFGILSKIIQDEIVGASVPGFHLEGPYISPIDGFRGAHNKEYIKDPDWEEFSAWYEASGRNIIEVTVAPELPGAIDFIAKCRQLGITVALGHHNGTTPIIQQAVDAGASVSTHLGNGCANTIHRHDNPLWPQLAEDRLTASIIADGFHLRPEEVQTFYKVKGPERTILVSDVIRLAGLPPGTYEDFDQEVVVTPEGKVMMPAQNVLAGASFLITEGIKNMMAFTQCSLADAIHMTSRNPARLLGLHDRGEISPGKRADLVLFKLREDGSLDIRKTVVQGAVVFEQ